MSDTVIHFEMAKPSVNYTTRGATVPRRVQFVLGTAIAFPGNGHFYEFVSGAAVAWKDAKNQAAARNLYGLKGYLATPVNAAENAYIQRLLAGPAWMGACVMWNDQACDARATLPGFVVEYGGTPGDPQIVPAGSRNVNFSAK